MATKKSTKTAHVLNLISKKPAQPIENTENDEQSSLENTTAQKPAITSPVVSSIKSSLEKAARDEALSDKIKDTLLEELDAAEKNEEKEENQKPNPQPEPQLKNVEDFMLNELEETQEAKLDESEDVEEFIREGTPPAEEVIRREKPRLEEPERKVNINTAESESKASSTIKDALNDYLNGGEDNKNETSKTTVERNQSSNPPEQIEPPKTPYEKEFLYMNVIEVLVREQIATYIEKFNVCKCSRCVADVMALALSNLPPKYIVIENHDKIAQLLNFYDSKFSVSIITELTKACIKVSESPRHKNFG